jgi:hypothetical protein
MVDQRRSAFCPTTSSQLVSASVRESPRSWPYCQSSSEPYNSWRKRRFGVSRRDEDGPRGATRRQRLVRWVVGLLVTALGATLVGVLTDVPAQLIDLDWAKDRLRAGPDLRARVDVMHLDDQGYSMAFANQFTPTPSERPLMRSPSYENRDRLSLDLRRRGGFDVERLTLRVVLEGRSNQEIRVVDIRPKDVRRTPPVAGTLFFMPPQAGAASIELLLNFDDSVPAMRTVKGFDAWGARSRPPVLREEQHPSCRSRRGRDRDSHVGNALLSAIQTENRLPHRRQPKKHGR